MTKKNENNYSVKHGADRKINPDLAEMIKKKVSEGKVPCAVAFKIAEEMNVNPAEVGTTLDLLGIKITKCQLGIFGYTKENKFIRPMEDVPHNLEKLIREGLTNGKLPCRIAWKTAESYGISKMDVASACDKLVIKINLCQLGAF